MRALDRRQPVDQAEDGARKRHRDRTLAGSLLPALSESPTAALVHGNADAGPP